MNSKTESEMPVRLGPEDRHALKRYRLQDRDKHLLALLGMCRYLTTEQVRRLCFAGRTQTPAEKRLRQLGGIGKYGFPLPLVERRIHRDDWDGTLVPAWKPTRRGWAVACALVEGLTVPPRKWEVAEAFMSHALALNDFFVSLAEATTRKALANRREDIPRRRHRSASDGLYTNAKALAFRWIASDSTRLPWRQQLEGKKHREHVIYPDAILELPRLKRRLFLECEMGTHTIVPRPGSHKPNATVAKAERYHRYFRDGRLMGERTWYHTQYRDGFAPEVLYLVHSEARASHVNEAISAWAGAAGELVSNQVALTWPRATRHVLESLGEWAPELEPPVRPGSSPRTSTAPVDAPRRSRGLTVEEVTQFGAFYRSSVDTLRREQQLAEAWGKPAPELPPNQPFIRVLLRTLMEDVGMRQRAPERKVGT